MQPLRILTKFFQKKLGYVFFLLGCVVCDGVEFAELPVETGISSLYLRSTWTGEEGVPGGIVNGIVITQLRVVVRALRGRPTPLGVMLNASEPLFDDAYGCAAAQTEASLAAMTDQVLDFARMRRAA